MALTATDIQRAFQNSLGRDASQSDINSYVAVSQSGALTDAQIYATISNSQEANLISDPAVRFYQAAFGRVPDAAGLDNTQDYIRANGASATTYQTLANMFVQSPEFQARFGSGTTVDAAYVQALYTTILSRQASAAEINAFTSGANGYTTRGGVLYAISQSQEAISISDNAVNGFLQNAAEGDAVYTGTLYTQANGQPNVPGAPTLTLTTGADNIVGSSGSDIINGVIDGNNTTLTVADTINGGAGTDSLNILVNDGGPVNIPLTNVTNVENFFVRHLVGGDVTFNAASVTGEQQVWNDRSVAGGTVIVNNLGTGATIGVRGDGSTQLAATNFSYASATDAVTIAIDGGTQVDNAKNTSIQRLQADEAAVTINSTGGANKLGVIDLSNGGATIESVTINASTSLNARLSANDYAADASLKITGAGGVNLSNAVLSANITTIDASGSSARVNIDASAGGDLTFTGGSGNDRLVLAGTLTTGDTLVGGAGTDTLSITGDTFVAGNAALAALNSKVTGFEALEFTGNGVAITGGTGADSFTNTEITKLIFNTAGDDTVNAAGSTRTYAAGDANTGNLSLNGANGVTTFNVAVEGDDGAGGVIADLNAKFTAAGNTQPTTGTINVNSVGEFEGAQAANTIDSINATNGNAAVKATVNVTGDYDLTIGGSTSAVTVNAGNFTGKLNVTGSTGSDTITLGSAADTVNVQAAGSTYTNLDTINSFTAADTLKLAGVVTAANNVGLTKFDATNSVSFEQALTSAEATVNGTTAAYFNFGGNTYVVSNQDAGNSATANGSTDLVVKITGVQTLTADANGIHGA